MHFRRTYVFLSVCLSAIAQNVHRQDTLHIDLKGADSIFLAKNFQLQASSMNIEA